MLRYANYDIVCQEIPGHVSLALNIANCPCRCPGCHSKYLWADKGIPLTTDELDRLITQQDSGITCLAFMGGDAEPGEVSRLAAYTHAQHPELKVAWYSGRTVISQLIDRQNFDFIKIGPYLSHLGPLNKQTTNQRLYRRQGEQWEDITSAFWRK